MNFFQSLYTDIGIHRKSNQDSIGLFKASTDRGEVLFALVCDGMGGYENGELASRILIETFENWFKCEFPYFIYDVNFSYEELFKQWGRIIYDCNEKLVQYGMNHGISLGSTLTAVLFVENEYFMAHVGDSRALVITPDKVYQMTRDQSVVAEAVRRGEITPEQAKTDRRRNMLLECIGVTPEIHPLFYKGKYRERDTFLLCSDGFWHNLTDDELIRYLGGRQFNENRELHMRLNYLIELDKTRGEKDNLSAVAVVPYRAQVDPDTEKYEKTVENTSRAGAVSDRTGDTNPVNALPDDLPRVRVDRDTEEGELFTETPGTNLTQSTETDDSETVNLYVSRNSSASGVKPNEAMAKTIGGRFYIMIDEKEVRESADGSSLSDI